MQLLGRSSWGTGSPSIAVTNGELLLLARVRQVLGLDGSNLEVQNCSFPELDHGRRCVYSSWTSEIMFTCGR